MTLSTLVLMIGAIALALTMLVKLVFKADKSLLVSYFQNFCGALFIFSGWVKAIDPLGTAYKMEQYFAEFESTFEGTWMSFIAPMFPWLSEYAIGFSVFMIVFEIVLGVMLLIGARPKFTAWAFLSLVGFFTVLTGFTYLTGYVPQEVNFFEFGKWGPYVETNMKVTDCGCFGDFLKLKPKVSFFKDIFLMIPALMFVWKTKDMHELFGGKVRTGLVWGSTALITLYCLSNFVWDLPHTDFRPFKKGADVAEIKKKEEEIAANVKVIAYKLTNKESGEVTELPYAQFLKEYKNYPKEAWEYDQITSTPESEPTKISDFALTDLDGNDMTEEVLSDPSYSVMIVCYKFYYAQNSQTFTVQDTTFVTDTVQIDGTDSIQLVQRVGDIKTRQVQKAVHLFDKDYVTPFNEKITPFAEAAEAAGLKVYGVVGGAGSDIINDFRHETQSPYPFYEADDILLKTIVRSNPGVVLWKDGQIINKWHHKKLPTFEEVKAQDIQ
ncbi:MAG: DoxX family protein [Bacteroidota bacterium]